SVWRESESLADRAQMFLDQVCREAIMSGRYGCVRGENHLISDTPPRFLKVDSLRNHTPANHFQGREGTMPLVQMQHARIDVQCPQRPHPSCAQQVLLADAHTAIPVIKACR